MFDFPIKRTTATNDEIISKIIKRYETVPLILKDTVFLAALIFDPKNPKRAKNQVTDCTFKEEIAMKIWLRKFDFACEIMIGDRDPILIHCAIKQIKLFYQKMRFLQNGLNMEEKLDEIEDLFVLETPEKESKFILAKKGKKQTKKDEHIPKL